MRVLTIHNKYQKAGGEDSVFEAEAKLLTENGCIVDKLLFDNSSIESMIDKVASGIRVVFNPQSALKLAARIFTFKPDVIHVHNFVPLASPSIFFTAKKYRVPVVVTLHNYRLLCPSAILFHKNEIYEKSVKTKFPLEAVWRGVYRDSRMQTAAVAGMTFLHNCLGTWKQRIDKYIVLTQFARDKFIDSALNIDSGKFIVKSNFVTDSGEGMSQRKNYYLYVGRLSPEKGIDTMLEAAKIYKFNLKIIGDGPLRETVQKYVAACSNISYLGYQQRLAINTYLKECKALIFPSTWYETFGMTIIEAFSAGTPVIASRLGAMKELIKAGTNGLHFEAGMPEDLVTKIKQFDENAYLQELLRQGARKSYINLYTPQKNYEDLMNIYNDVIRDIGPGINKKHKKLMRFF